MSEYYRDCYAGVRKQHGQLIMSVDPATRSKLYKRTIHIASSDYTPLRQPDAGTGSLVTLSGITPTAYFYEETQPHDIGAGMLELDEFYAEIPATYTEPTTIAYEYQYIYSYTDGGTGYTTIGKTTRSVAAISVNTFGLVGYDNSGSLATHLAARYESNRTGSIYTVGSFSYHSSGSTTNYLASDSHHQRWHGPIFCRTEIFVEPYQQSLL